MALPGVRAQLMDLYSALRYRSDIATPRVLCIGRMLVSGAANLHDPARYTTEASVVSAFGTGSELHKAFVELLQSGATDIWLEAISPSADRFEQLELAYESAEGALPEIIVPYGKGTDTSGVDAGVQPTDGAYANVSSSENVTNEVQTFLTDTITVNLPYEVTVSSVTGHTRATPVEFEENTHYTYDSTSGVITRVDVEDGIEEGESVQVDYSYEANYANQLATWCERFTDLGIPCIGVIGCQPLEKSEGDDADYINESQKQDELDDLLDELPVRGSETVDADLGERGKYISVVLGECKMVSQNSSWGFNNCACPYAGKMATLPVQSAPTNKPLYNVNALRYTFSRSYAETFTDAGVTCVSIDSNDSPSIVDATTYAAEGSDYWRLSTIRITMEAIKQVTLASMKFIGEGASNERRNALETAIRGVLHNMKRAGALNDADFHITFYASEHTATVDLILTPAWEIRIIRETVTIQTD